MSLPQLEHIGISCNDTSIDPDDIVEVGYMVFGVVVVCCFLVSGMVYLCGRKVEKTVQDNKWGKTSDEAL